jgi:glycosyltransferase involved in cell wall biosynthesis
MSRPERLLPGTQLEKLGRVTKADYFITVFSILILTKNEEQNIADCIKAVSWCGDIVVLDSFSSDATCEIARAAGAKVFQRAFDDFGAQRTFALDNIPFANPWVFHLDADERFNEALRLECERVIAEDTCSACFVPNRVIFLGRWIKHSSQYPYHQVRLVKRGEVRFAKSGHGQREDQARRGVAYIEAPYDHFNFSKGLAEWVDKHNRYSTAEALESSLSEASVSLSLLFSRDPIARKRCMKSLHARLPGRWAWKFFYLYFFKRGFLDGYPGFVYCLLQGFYDFLIDAKIHELKSHRELVEPQ